MKCSRSQKKAKLMAKAEELFEQLLNWDENTPRRQAVDLTEGNGLDILTID